jgi:hypothetical protein
MRNLDWLFTDLNFLAYKSLSVCLDRVILNSWEFIILDNLNGLIEFHLFINF